MISICIASCLNYPERNKYLEKVIKSCKTCFSSYELEFLIGFDKYGTEIDGTKCYTHNKGLGHSWNWCIQNASYDLILQIEDDWKVEIGNGNIGNIDSKEDFMNHVNNRIDIINEYGGIYKFTNIDDKFWSNGKTEREFNGYKFKELNKPDKYKPNTWDMYLYSNQPHLKNKNLHDKVGYFKENVCPAKVEIDMCEQFFKSNERVFLSPFFTFVHIGVVQSRPQ